MSHISAFDYHAFQTTVREEAAYFRPDRPSAIVSQSGHGDQPDIFAGLMVATEGTFRLALDKVNNTVVLLGSKVADNLRGEFDAASGEIRPTREGLEKSYGISALSVETGGPILPPHRAQHIQKAMQAHKAAIRTLNTEHLNLYGMSFGDRTIWGNKRIAYLMDKNGEDDFTVSVVIPKDQKGEGFLPHGVKKGTVQTLLRKRLAHHVSQAQAQTVFAKHWQVVTSKIWDHENPYTGQRMEMKRTLTEIGSYAQKRGMFIVGGLTVAGSFLAIKEPELGSAIGALAAAHTAADIMFHETIHRGAEWVEKRFDPRTPDDLQSYAGGEAIDFYLDRNKANLKKLTRHIDLEKFSPEDFRFLTIEEMKHMLRPHQDFEENLRPTSLSTLVHAGSRRGFTPRVTFPAPLTQMEMFQSGLIVLKHAMDDGRMLMYATHRPEVCVNEDVALPQAYVDQLNDGGPIQRFIYDPRRVGSYGDAFEQQAATYEEMKQELEGLLFPKPDHYCGYAGEIALRFQEESLVNIEGYFNPDIDRNADPALSMGGTEPAVPSHRCIS